jgi:hypothetical protein
MLNSFPKQVKENTFRHFSPKKEHEVSSTAAYSSKYEELLSDSWKWKTKFSCQLVMIPLISKGAPVDFQMELTDLQRDKELSKVW